MDKFILTKSLSQPVVYTFYSTIFMFGALLAWPFGVGWLAGIDWLWAVISGLAFGLGLWTFYIAIKKGEASHINPFNGAIITVATYLISSNFLGEELSQTQLAGIGLLVFASFLLSFEKSRGHNGFHIGFIWAVISGVLFATSHILAKYLYEAYPFLTGFVWTRFFIGLVGLFTLLYPSVRKSFCKNKEKTTGKHVISIVVLNKILAVISVVLVQYAAAIGSITLVMALSGTQFVLMFILIYLLTKFIPSVFKEYFTKKELWVELIAVILVAFGSALFVL